MNRRGFLGSLLAAATFDPERALWTPGKKTISIPAPRVDNDWGKVEFMRIGGPIMDPWPQMKITIRPPINLYIYERI